MTDKRLKLKELAYEIELMEITNANIDAINTMIREYNMLAKELNKTCTSDWAKYEYKKEQMI